MAPRRHTEEELLGFLREAAQGAYLSLSAYKRLRQEDWPGANTIAQRFGTWRKALAAAGLPVAPREGPPRYFTSHGYVYTRRDGKAIPEHRAVMEEQLGRSLLPGETVHHRNGVKHDNSPGNLQLKVRAHGPGLDIEDAVAWAKEILRRYEDVCIRPGGDR